MIKIEIMKKTQFKKPAIKLTIQSINDIITNSSSEVVVRYDKEGVKQLKELVNSIIAPFTELKFDDLFTLTYSREFYDWDDNDSVDDEIPEDHPDLDKILENSWKKTWDGGYPDIQGVIIRPREGKECMKQAADLLQTVANIFDTEIIYG
jgi:hypothetical protein